MGAGGAGSKIVPTGNGVGGAGTNTPGMTTVISRRRVLSVGVRLGVRVKVALGLAVAVKVAVGVWVWVGVEEADIEGTANKVGMGEVGVVVDSHNPKPHTMIHKIPNSPKIRHINLTFAQPIWLQRNKGERLTSGILQKVLEWVVKVNTPTPLIIFLIKPWGRKLEVGS
jgi:hypothetical protein